MHFVPSEHQPGLFDAADSDLSCEQKLTIQAPGRNTRNAVATQRKPRAIAVLPSQIRIASQQPKRRRRYQLGTLYLEPRKRGPSWWVYRYFQVIGGEKIRRKKKVGTLDEFPTEDDAKRASEHLRMRANVENVQPNVTMRGLVDRYLNEVLKTSLDLPVGGLINPRARVRFSAAKSARWALLHYILPAWEPYTVRDFEKPEIQASAETWFDLLLQPDDEHTGLAPKSVHRVYSVMRHLFTFAVKWGYLKFHPFSEKRVQLPPGCTERLKEPVQISPAQLLLLMSSLCPREKLAVTLNGWLATRVSEAFGLTWEDIDFESGKVTFRKGFTTQGRISRLKTKASRGDFPLPVDVIELLRQWKAITPYNLPSDWVFASPFTQGKRPFWPSSLMKCSIQPVAHRLGLPHIGWHTLRHSFSAYAKEVLSPHDVRTLLRHQSLQMTDQYGRVELERKRKLQAKVMRDVKKRARSESESGRDPASACRQAS